MLRHWLFILLLISTSLNAAKKEIQFNPFSKEQGLPGDNVQSIFQDSYGYIWFGIESVGLCKYDGKRYYVYGMEKGDSTSLSTSFINFIVEDANGDLWLATEQGLNIFHRDKGVFTSYFTPQLPNNRIKTITKDRSNAIWIGTEKGAVRFIPNQNRHTDQNYFGFSDRNTNYIIDNNIEIEAIDKDIVNSIVDDAEGNYWIGTFSGLFKYTPNNDSSKCQKIIIDNSDITANKINHIALLPNEQLLLGTNVGLNFFSKTDNSSINLNVENNNSFNNRNFGVTKILIDSNGITWIGTNSKGILVDSNIHSDIVIPHAIKGLEGTHIRDIFEDRTGQIWVITKYAGIFVFDPRSQLFPHYSTTKNNLNFILSSCESANGTIYLGTKFGSLLEFNTKTSSLQQNKIYLGDEYLNRIECVFEDSTKHLWLGFKRGVVMLDSDFKVKKFYESPKVYGMKMSSSGILWVFTVDGVYHLNPKTNQLEPYDLSLYGKPFTDPTLLVQGIYTDKQNNRWFVTFTNGILKYDAINEKLFWFKNEPENPSSLSGNVIRSFIEDANGTIWIGTKFSGLNKYNPASNTFDRYTITNGLPSNAIYSVIDDKLGNIWLTTNNGVSKFDLEKNRFFNFNESHGLQGNVFEARTSIRLKNDNILFGGNNGFNIFSPEKANIDLFNPPLVVTNIQAGNKSISKDLFTTHDVFIPYKNAKLITFEFAALDYRDPSIVKYAYQLDGVDEQWINANQNNVVTYSKLPHGKYRFRFKATNADQIWTENYLEVNIVIETPFWLRWWAYLVYFILGLASFFGIYQIAIIRANFRHKLFMKEQEIKRDNELNQMKLRFFTNISHEIRTPLTLILAPLQKLISNNQLSETNKKRVELIDRSANRLLKLTDQLLYFRKTQQESQQLEVIKGDIVNFLNTIISPFYELADSRKLKFKFEHEFDQLEAWFDPDKIEKIVSNLLSNAFKFTLENGTVVLRIKRPNFNQQRKPIFQGHTSLKSDYYQLSVSDSGIGMTEKQVQHIFERFYQTEPFDIGVGIGLELVKQLSELHKGKIEVSSVPNTGTTFTLYLPLNKSTYTNKEISTVKIDRPIELHTSKTAILYENEKTKENHILDASQKSKDKPTLLIVEDELELQAYLAQLFSGSYSILVANNGIEGLDIAVKEVPDLIITDVMMPLMNGLQFCQKVKSDVNTSHIPLIMLTAKNMDDEQLEGLHSGADDYIYKPFNEEILFAKIENTLALRNTLRDKYSKDITISPSELCTNKTDEDFILKLLKTIDKDISNTELTIQDIANQLNMDRSNLFKKIKSIFGISPSQFLREHRIKNAAKLLVQHKHNINEVSYMVGFTSPAYFSKLFKEIFHQTPSEFLSEKRKP